MSHHDNTDQTPGAVDHSPFHHGGGPGSRIGVLVLHGFTGSPHSVRAWAERFAQEGHRVSLPLLPGHGTDWKDMEATSWRDWYGAAEREYLDLSRSCDRVFVAGLSMGGALALRLAEHHPAAGVMVVNPGLTFNDVRVRFSGILRHVLRSVPGVGDDIKKEGVTEGAYGRVPVRSVHELRQLFADTVENLGRVTAPTLVFRSTVDRVVPDSSVDVIRKRLGGGDLRIVPLTNSHHVATIDHDAPFILEESAAFVRRQGALLP